jgi:hypothetical protein
METDAAVDKVSDPKSCPQRLGKACWLSLSFHRPGGGQPTNNKTGQITCYKNRTFSFATDSAKREQCQKRRVSLAHELAGVISTRVGRF